MSGSPVVLHLHGGGFDRFASAAHPLVRSAIRHTFQKADRVIVLTPEWKERVEAFSGRSDAIVIGNPVLIPPPLGRSKDLSGLFVGRLTAEKGVPDLIEAVRLMQVAGHRNRWYLVGEGGAGMSEMIARLPEPALIEMLGWLDGERLDDVFSRSAVFCLPSHMEGAPVALLEAMAHGLACVATPVGGVPSLVTEGDNGLLVPPSNPSALASALTRVFEEDDLRERLGDAARKRIERDSSVEVIAGQLSELYRSLDRCSVEVSAA
jgi:glycosyltransferase involved in cell wall biosynthesis